jgi:hypothetical protein
MRKQCLYSCSIPSFFILLFIYSRDLLMRDKVTLIILYHQGNDLSTFCCFLWSINRRICSRSRRTTETARNPHKGLCTKNRQTLIGYIWRHGKWCFYVSSRSPSSWNCWSCSSYIKNSRNFTQIKIWDFSFLPRFHILLIWILLILIKY